MGVKDVLSRKEGVIVGDDVLALFKHAQENNYAVPAIVSAVESVGQLCLDTDLRIPRT